MPELESVRAKIQEQFDTEISKIKNNLMQSHNKLADVAVSPVIDFIKAVSSIKLQLDCGEGLEDLDLFGEGTKKRIWMGLLEWEKTVSPGKKAQSTIRLYDEPDVNLHYDAQRKLFSNIHDITSIPNLHTQCFVSTHSVTLIDRAPTRSVNLIQIADRNQRELIRIRGTQDSEMLDFWNDIGVSVGLSNTTLLYERGFLIVEGESEYEAVPTIYKNIYGKTIREDGIVLINLHTCSAWKSVIEVLLSNRRELTHLLLDADCKEPDSSGYITEDLLKELKCPKDFLEKQVTYIGKKEYEDAFSSSVITDALNSEFPKQNGSLWHIEDVDNLKSSVSKFSEGLRNVVIGECKKELRSTVKKPALAGAIARKCKKSEDVPEELLRALNAVRSVVGVNL